jgi:hypothetical protein
MNRYARRIAAVLCVAVLLGVVLAPVASAWQPKGYPGGGYPGYPYYPGYGGYPYGYPGYGPGYGYGSPYGYPGNPYPYNNYYQPPALNPYPPAPPPQPFGPPEPSYSWAPMLPDPLPWGTFGTYDNWARQFYKAHGRLPTDQDVADFWYSQDYAAEHEGEAPW